MHHPCLKKKKGTKTTNNPPTLKQNNNTNKTQKAKPPQAQNTTQTHSCAQLPHLVILFIRNTEYNACWPGGGHRLILDELHPICG